MELNLSHVCTVGLLQSTLTHLARAVRMEHPLRESQNQTLALSPWVLGNPCPGSNSGNTCKGPNGSRAWVQAQFSTWQILPSENPWETFCGVYFCCCFGVSGLCLGEYLVVFLNSGMAAFLHLLPALAEQAWMDSEFTSLSRWQVKSCDILFPSHADHTVTGGVAEHSFFSFFSLSLRQRSFFQI